MMSREMAIKCAKEYAEYIAQLSNFHEGKVNLVVSLPRGSFKTTLFHMLDLYLENCAFFFRFEELGNKGFYHNHRKSNEVIKIDSGMLSKSNQHKFINCLRGKVNRVFDDYYPTTAMNEMVADYIFADNSKLDVFIYSCGGEIDRKKFMVI